MSVNPAGLGMFVIHGALLLGVLANLIVIVRFIRTGNGIPPRKDKP